MAAKELKRYFFRLKEAITANGKVESIRLPEGKKLLIKMVTCVITGFDTMASVDIMQARVQLLTNTSAAFANLPNNIVADFVVQKIKDVAGGDTALFVPVMPLVWVPPPALMVYGSYLKGSLDTDTSAGLIEADLVVYGTLQDMTPLEEVQQTQNL